MRADLLLFSKTGTVTSSKALTKGQISQYEPDQELVDVLSDALPRAIQGTGQAVNRMRGLFLSILRMSMPERQLKP